MPEIRKNLATKEWVIVPIEATKPPQEYIRQGQNGPKISPEECPFCPGNESKTPPEKLAYRPPNTGGNERGWWVRIISDKNPMLSATGELKREQSMGFYWHLTGVGHHEIIIETPNHHEVLGSMDSKQAEEALLGFRERFLFLSRDRRIKMITLYKNHGSLAGATQEHEHSHIIATPMVPLRVKVRLEEARNYYEENGTCVFCDMISAHEENSETMILENEGFVAFEPIASMFPFETWIIPKEHGASFGQSHTEEVKQFAHVVNEVLRRIKKGLNNPDFNLYLYTAPIDEQAVSHYHWYLQIVPRFRFLSGIEMGLGMYVNPLLPEQAAKFLREV